MSIGNTEAIRDWFTNSRYNKSEIIDIYEDLKGTDYTINISAGANANAVVTENSFPNRTYTVTTDNSGNATLEEKFVQGMTIIVSMDGYISQNVVLDSTTTVSITLEKSDNTIYLFKDGVLDTSIGNGIDFVTQVNGTNNRNTFEQDGYIRLGYTNSSSGESLLYTHNKVYLGTSRENALYSKLKVKFKLVADRGISQYNFRFGLDTQVTNQGHINYHYISSPTFTPSQDIQTYELDISEVTDSISEAYINVGRVQQELYIYEIGLVPK